MQTEKTGYNFIRERKLLRQSGCNFLENKTELIDIAILISSVLFYGNEKVTSFKTFH
ncbi:hypothetical protein J11TS1_18250 [Oceanobacillus sp. J11TS1]|nr:hypothetical protein J11TS1_18250 [Oceanobacillus sp. J11TS1]